MRISVFRPGQHQANATFGKTMEQLRNRQNVRLRSEITPDAKFLALGITPRRFRSRRVF